MSQSGPSTFLLVDDRTVSSLEIAETWISRARGLLFRGTIPDALLLRPCTSVHGAWMRVPLDVALLDPGYRVLAVHRLRPWGMTRPRHGVAAVLEAPASSFERWGLAVGSRVAVG